MTITWLHLSDWHQKGQDFSRRLVGRKLIDDISKRTEISPDLEKIDFIIFSGDVAFSGKQGEYEKAREYLFEPLLEATNLTAERLFIVPGNHDLDETAFDLLPDEILHSFNSKTPHEESEKVNKWLTDERRRNRLLEPFAAFKQFVSVYTGQTHSDYGSLRRFKINGKRVALLGINSALMCRRNKDQDGEIDDKGFLTIGEPQIRHSLEQMKYYDLRIAVLHHPFDWLTEFERTQIETAQDFLKDVCQFILYGHEHKPKFIDEHGLNGECIIIPAGATYERRFPDNSLYSNAYNFVHIDLETNTGKIYLRRWQDIAGVWVDDQIITPNGNGQHEFHIPHKDIQRPKQVTNCNYEYDQHFKRLVRSIINGEVVPFLGANINLCDRPTDEQETLNPWEWDPTGDYPPTTLELANYLKGRDYLQEVGCPWLNCQNCPTECPINTGLINKIDIPHLSQYDRLSHPRILVKALEIYSNSYSPNRLHKLLANLPTSIRNKHPRNPSQGSSATKYQLIVTTNYDSTLEHAFLEAGQPFDLVSFIGIGDIVFRHQRFDWRTDGNLEPQIEQLYEDYIRQDQANIYNKFSLNDRPVILKLYGSAKDPDNFDFVITEDQFINYLVRSPIESFIPSSLLEKLKNSSIWFLGYSLSHWNQRVILNRLWPDQANISQSSKWFVIQPKEEPLDRKLWNHRDRHPIYLSEKNLFLENYVTELEERIRNARVRP